MKTLFADKCDVMTLLGMVLGEPHQRYVDESSAGARSMATIISNTVQKNTTISSSSSGRDGGEQGTSGTKIYHIHASGENNVYHFN